MARAAPPSSPDLQAQVGGGVVDFETLTEHEVYEILLRVSTKDACRLRAVCRSWRALLTDPQFVAKHAARHPSPPLVVAGYDTEYRHDGVVCDVVDFSGNVVRRVRTEGDECVTSVHLDFVCTTNTEDLTSVRLFNMTTGDVFDLPQGFAEEHAGDKRRDIRHYACVAALGRVASTEEYKVLRILTSLFFRNPQPQLCEVLTLEDSNHARWRGKNAPPNLVSRGHWKNAVVGGIVYFFGQDDAVDELPSFDLEREEWRPRLRGPNYQETRFSVLSMADVDGSLVIVRNSGFYSTDIWFLMDFEKGLWVKKYSLRLQVDCKIRPLLVLNDGRLVLVHTGSDDVGSLRIYDPRTETFVVLAVMGLCCAVGLYPGSPLSLSNRQII